MIEQAEKAGMEKAGASVKQILSRAGAVPLVLRCLAVLTALFLLVAFLAVAFGRLHYPFELDWMSGALLDHVDRLRQGLSIYVAPGPDFIPFLYPPLPYYLVNAASRFMASEVAYRALGIVSTLVQAFCVYRLARKGGATRHFAALGVGLFFGCFRLTAFFYDLDRPDPLTVALLAGAVVLLCEEGTDKTRPSLPSTASAGLLVGFAMLAKQQAIPFLGVLALILFLTNGVKRALTFAVPALAVAVPAMLWLEHRSGGWFSYYVFGLPARHGAKVGLLPIFLLEDLPGAWLLVAATFTFAQRSFRREQPILAGALWVGFLVAGMSRMHEGGWKNVLLFWSTFACAAVPIVLTRLSSRLTASFPKAPELLPHIALFAQLLLFVYNPADLLPSSAQAALDTRIAKGIAALEQNGEVLVHSRGHTTAHRHYHLAALEDLLKENGEPPNAWVEAVKAQRFYAIVLGRVEELGKLAPIVLAHYEVKDRLHDVVPTPGKPAPPTLVLLRR